MNEPAALPPALRATCWGTRGSIASPGPDTVRFGGNTPCLEVRTADGRCLIFDAGTGIRALSRRLEDEGPMEAHVFVSHYHWDHIQGFPFCAQLYDPRTRVCVHGPSQGEVSVDVAIAGQMSSLYFPIPLTALAARVEFARVEDGPWVEDGVEVAAQRVRHAGNTCGYRVRAGGASLAYVPDNELGHEGLPALVEFVRGVDLLFHDSMYTDEEYDQYRGWGHSSIGQAVRLAEEAEVRRLALFHHAPDRGDAELQRIADRLRGELAARGSALELSVATEGEEIALPGRHG
jgi:phosphoribosyl 1,2-cyclic phosphodiesterase